LGRRGAIIGINRKRAGKIVGHRPERVSTRPGQQGHPPDLPVLDRLSQRQGGLIFQRRKLGTKLPEEAKQRTRFFGVKNLGKNIAIIGIGASTELLFHHEEVEFVATGFEIHRLGTGTALAEEFGKVEASDLASEFKGGGEFRDGPTTGAK